jgi:predicted house-cleaning noncanonical NTP pyrophosphatase (MazG superfamily)
VSFGHEIVMYVCEILSLTENDKVMLIAKPMNILSTLYEKVYEQKICRITTNKQLREFYKILDLVVDIMKKNWSCWGM